MVVRPRWNGMDVAATNKTGRLAMLLPQKLPSRLSKNNRVKCTLLPLPVSSFFCLSLSVLDWMDASIFLTGHYSSIGALNLLQCQGELLSFRCWFEEADFQNRT